MKTFLPLIFLYLFLIQNYLKSEIQEENINILIQRQKEFIEKPETFKKITKEVEASPEIFEELLKVRLENLKKGLNYLNFVKAYNEKYAGGNSASKEYFRIKRDFYFSMFKKSEEKNLHLDEKFTNMVVSNQRKKNQSVKILKSNEQFNPTRITEAYSVLLAKGFITGDTLIGADNETIGILESQSLVLSLFNKGKLEEGEKKVVLLENAVKKAVINDKFCKLKTDRINELISKSDNAEAYLSSLQEISDLLYSSKNLSLANKKLNDLFSQLKN